ncbi:MAG TPA: glycosyltransferase family 4 protein [Candidatus Binataceae bacterium]|nr:glycosyltransferase family 4 protein [Candidatus Binataceae bacterium]
MDHCNHALATFLAERGTETHLVAYRVDDELARHRNITFHRVPKPLNSYFLANPLLDRFGRAAARKLARRSGRVVVNGGNCIWPDVNWIIHLHTRFRPAVVASPLRRLKAAIDFRQAALAERRALACAKVIIAGSRSTREELINDFGIPEARVHLVDLGIDAEKFRIPTETERSTAREKLGLADETIGVAFVGGLGDRRKGFDTLYSAWRTLCAAPAWRAKLVVVGAGVELTAWIARARADGLADRISFLGFNSRQDFVVEVLRGCDVMVAPTRYEGYGLAIKEAVCTGLPTIVTRTTPIAEQMVGAFDEIMISDPESAEEVANRLRICFSRLSNLRHEAALLSTRLRRWRWKDMAAKIVEIIESCGTGDL